MELHTFKDYHSMSHAASDSMLRAVMSKPDAVICLATGHTPCLTYRLWVEKILQKNINVSNCFFIGLDEWVGIRADKEGTCHHFLYNYIFHPLHVPESNLHLFNPMSKNLEEECVQMNEIIHSRNGIDMITLGIGMNGHLGFNEPGASLYNDAHVVKLDATTQTVGQKYFATVQSISRGITIGLRQIMQSKKIIVLANGFGKAHIIKQALEGKISTSLPASLLRNCHQATCYIDEEAATLLRK